MSQNGTESVAVESILDGVDFEEALDVSEHYWKLMRQAAHKLHECGRLDKKELANGSGLTPAACQTQVLRPACKAALFRSHEQATETGFGKLSFLYSFELEDAERLGREYPAPAPHVPLSAEEAKSCLSTMNDRNTGLAAGEGNTLVRIVLKCCEGPQTKTEIRNCLGIGEHKTDVYCALAVNLELLELKKRGRKKADYFHNVAGIRSFAMRLPGRKRRKWPIDQLPNDLRGEIESIHFERDKIRPGLAWWIANFIAAIRMAGGTIKLSAHELGLKCGLNPLTTAVRLTAAVRTAYILSEHPVQREAATLTVNKSKVNSRIDGTTPERPLGQFWTDKTLADCWPQTERWTPEQRAICDAIDEKILGMDEQQVKDLLGMSMERWFYSRPILAAVGPGHQRTYFELARELGCSRRQLQTQVPKMKNAKWYTLNENRGGIGEKPSDHAPDWSKIEQLAGVKLKASTNGRAKARSNGAAKKKARATVGQKPDRRNRTADWLLAFKREEPGASLEQAVRAYNAQSHNEKLLSRGAADQILRRRNLSWSVPTELLRN